MGVSNTYHELVCESCGKTHYSKTTRKQRCDECNPLAVRRRQASRGNIRSRSWDDHCYTQKDVGEFFGISTQRADQVEKAAIAKLRKNPLLKCLWLERQILDFYF